MSLLLDIRLSEAGTEPETFWLVDQSSDPEKPYNLLLVNFYRCFPRNKRIECSAAYAMQNATNNTHLSLRRRRRGRRGAFPSFSFRTRF